MQYRHDGADINGWYDPFYWAGSFKAGLSRTDEWSDACEGLEGSRCIGSLLSRDRSGTTMHQNDVRAFRGMASGGEVR